MIKSKMKGEVAQVKEEKPKEPVAKSMMEARCILNPIMAVISKRLLGDGKWIHLPAIGS